MPVTSGGFPVFASWHSDSFPDSLGRHLLGGSPTRKVRVEARPRHPTETHPIDRAAAAEPAGLPAARVRSLRILRTRSDRQLVEGAQRVLRLPALPPWLRAVNVAEGNLEGFVVDEFAQRNASAEVSARERAAGAGCEVLLEGHRAAFVCELDGDDELPRLVLRCVWNALSLPRNRTRGGSMRRAPAGSPLRPSAAHRVRSTRHSNVQAALPAGR